MEKQYYETVNALPTVKELREISKDRPDTFLNGALYIIDLLRPVNLSTHDREAWVKVEDGMPPYNKRVLIYKSYHDQVDIALRLLTDSEGEKWSCEYSHYVTHWQPLPEKPSK